MKDPLLYRTLIPLIKVWFKTCFRPVYINKEVIPKEGGVLLAGNHTSKADVFIVASATKRCVRGVAKSELFKGPAKYFFRGMGAIPVNRGTKDSTVIPACVEVLNNGGLIGILPEGTINRTDDIIMPFKTGAVRMSIESNAPIVPFAIISEPIKNYGSFKKGVKIAFGTPYHPKTDDIIKETKLLEKKVIDLLKKHGE